MNGTLVHRLEDLSPTKIALLEKRFGRTLARSENPFVITRRSDRSSAPLSFSQEGLLFMEHLEPGTSRYNISDAIRVEGRFEAAVVREALDQIVSRHESLRTVFTNVDGAWLQSISECSTASFAEVQLPTADTGSGPCTSIDLIQAEADRPMDLCEGPLFSAKLFRFGEGDSVLLIKMHHIISDGWSLGLFWNEFATIYTALVEGRTAQLPELPIQFGDYAAWSSRYLAREIERQTAYWAEQLKGAPALLEMPTDRPRPAVQTANGAQEVASFESDLLHRINDLAKREGSTLYMTLLAGFECLLARYTGTRDLVVGTPIAGRNRTETENTIGFFVNTLVLRNDMSGDPSFREVLSRVRKTVLDAFSHQELPFEKVVAALRPERSLSYNPIYQIAFALQDAAGSKISIPYASVAPLKLGLNASKFDLFLSAREADEGFAVTVEYNTDLFDKDTILRFISHYRNLLEAVVTDPDERLSDIPVMSHAERRNALVEWNATSADYPQEAVHRLFEVKAADVPKLTAIVAGREQFTYEQLDQWSNKVANFLRSSGVGVGQRIGICLNRSPEMIAATLGILKCGASYVPMDPANPGSRLQQLVEDSGLSIVFTNSEFRASFGDCDVTLLDVDRQRHDIEKCSAASIGVERGPEDIACVMYTSGSTGQPKGAQVPHRAVNRLVLNTDYVHLGEQDRIAHVSNVAFDAAIFEIWGALLNGGCIVILDKDLVLSPKNFAAELKSAGITAMFLTTSLFNLISREVPDAFSAIGTLLTGGEQFDPAAARSVFASGPPKRLLHVYGPTESTTFATWKELSADSIQERTVPIGKPIANTTVFLLDEQLNPVPVGVVGEIFLGGDGLANGYLNRPELNEERFLDVPAHKISFSLSNGTPTKLYRTGDLAKYLPNGDVEYIGRKDNQVKIRGFRIELGEVESVVESHPKVAQAVVLAIRDNVDHRMVAFYVPDGSEPIDLEQLREFVREKLPNYMVPAAWVELPEFPINRNGKIDRGALASNAASLEAEASESAENATDELEVKLTWIWRRILGTNSIGIHENFFDLGGHSLAAVKLFSEIEKTLGCRLQLATLFHAPTIAQLSELIRQGGWQSTWRSLVPIRLNGSKPPFFCVHAVGGNILEYNGLAAYLSPDQPYYGLQSIGLDGRSAPLTDIRSMAAAYIKEIRAVQPHGPYHLGGRSFGGTVAYEMARQLTSEGEEVAMLAIFDSYPKGWRKLFPREVASAYSRRFMKLRFERHLKIWARLGTLDKIRYGSTKVRYKSRKLKNLAWRLLQQVRPAADSVSSLVRNIEEINYSALRSYVPDEYPGKLTFFCADEEVCPEENLTGWRRLALGGVDVINVPGDHQTMIKDPHVAVLADRLEKALQASISKVSEAGS